MVYADIGGSHITLIAGEILSDGSVKILGNQTTTENVTENVNAGIIKNTTAVAYHINTLVKYLQNACHLEEIRQLSTSINARSMKTYFYSVKIDVFNRKITENDLKKCENKCLSALQSPKNKIFQISAVQYIIDGKKVENPKGLRGRILQVDYSVVWGNFLVSKNYKNCFERTGIQANIYIGMEAVAKAVLSQEDKQGVALLMFGATSTTLGIYQKGVLIDMLVVPFGGDNITNDIAEIGIDKQNAEFIKNKKGKAMESLENTSVVIKIPNADKNKKPVKLDTAFLAKIIELRLDEMLQPIINRINLVSDVLPNGLVITGRTTQLNGLSEYLIKRTKLNVRLGNHSDWLSKDTDAIFHDTRYSQAIGTLLLNNGNYNYTITANNEQTPPSQSSEQGFRGKVAMKISTLFD